MSYREVLLLVLLSQIVLVFTRAVVKRSAGSLNELDAFRDVVNSKASGRESVKRDIQTQGMAQIEFCFRRPTHPRCRQQQKTDYSVQVIQN